MEQAAGVPAESRTIRVKVLYFAQARDLSGSREEQLEVTRPARVSDLVSKAIEIHPRLGEIRKILRVILNGTMMTTYDKEEIGLHDGDTVALMPPIAGG